MSTPIKYSYVKLSDKASLFYCPKCKLKVTINNPARIETSKITKKVKASMGSGHLVSILKNEYDKSKISTKETSKIIEEAEATISLAKLTKAKLHVVVSELSNIDDDKVEQVMGLNKADIVSFIEEYDEDEDSQISDEDEDEDEDDE